MAYDPAPQANAMAALRFDPQMAAINRQITDLQAQTASNNTGLDTYNTEGTAGINKAYDLTDTAHTNLGTAAMGALHTVGDKIGQTWADATAVQQANRDQSNKQLGDYAAKYGLQDAGLSNMTKLDEQIQKMINTNTTQGATQQGAADSIMGANRSFYDAWKTIDQASRAKGLSTFADDVLRARSANQLAGLKGQNELYGKLNDTMGQRNSFLTDEMNQLVQADWDREFRTNQAKWQADVENAKLAAQQGKDARDESLGWAQLMQSGIANEGKRLIDQQNADANTYGAHKAPEKPYNDLQVMQSIYSMAGGGNGNVPGKAALETAWDQAKYMGLVDGQNPYTQAPQEAQAASNGQGVFDTHGGIGGVLSRSWLNPFRSEPSANPFHVPNIREHLPSWVPSWAR